MELNLVYLPVDYLGYGRSGIDLEASLAACGVRSVPLEDGRTSGRSSRSGICDTALWVSAPDLIGGWWQGQFRVMLTMYETLSVPPMFRAGLQYVDRVLVPSKQNLEMFSAFHDGVVEVALGIDTERWCFRARVEPTATFRFLSCGSGARKGGDLAARAFAAAFPKDPRDGPVPELVMKVPRGPEHFGRRISHVPGWIASEDEVELYASAHCFLGPSRGEGFGLQPLQAIAQGCPTILTAAHGHERFADLGIGIGARIVPAGRFSYGPSGEWWEPEFDELVAAIRRVYEHYAEACSAAETASVVARERLNLARSGESVIAAIGVDHIERSYGGSRRWQEPSELGHPARVWSKRGSVV